MNKDIAVPKELRREYGLLFVYAIMVGFLGGGASIAFKKMVCLVQSLAIGTMKEEILHFVAATPWWILIVAPAVGGLLTGVLIHLFAREAKGHGVPEVMLAVARKGGKIRGRVAVIKSIASAITIGSGGSTGREGPIVQISSAIGSYLGQLLGVPERRLRTLVACGAAAGIAGTFNAPIAGAIFALEVIIGEMRVTHFSAIVVSSFMSTLVSRHYFGNVPALHMPKYVLPQLSDYPFVVLLAFIIGILAWAYVKVLYSTEAIFDRWNIPEWIKPAVGGALLGLVIIRFPQVYGGGYDTITEILAGRLPLLTVAALVFVKLFATCLTLGSGGSGGIFAPALFIGAAAGGAFGLAADQLTPGLVVASPMYALIGMGAFVGAATHAPIQAILIIFEMTSDYGAILPLMLCTVLATMVSIMLSRESIYTMKLVLRGINIYAGQDESALSGASAGEYMDRDPVLLDHATSIRELKDKISGAKYYYFPVVDMRGGIAGIATLPQITGVLMNSGTHPDDTVLSHFTPREAYVVETSTPLSTVIHLMDAREIDSLVVVGSGTAMYPQTPANEDSAEVPGNEAGSGAAGGVYGPGTFSGTQGPPPVVGIIRRMNVIKAFRELALRTSLENK